MNDANVVRAKIGHCLCYQGSSNSLLLPIWMNSDIQEDAVILPIAK